MDETRLIFPFSLKEREIEMKKRVYTLYRVSTKGQVEKDDIPMQKEACRNFAESQGWEIVKEFSEKGVSGFKKSAKERDELQKIQQAAMEGKFDILLVFMFDRLGRRDDETPFIVEWFTKQGIEVWSVNEGQQRFDTHVDKLMNYIRYWQASGESLKTSVRTRTRLEQLTGEGHYTGGTVAFGYKRVRLGRVNKKNQEVCDLVVDEAEAEIVRLIFHKYVYEGYGAQKLSHYLYEQGVVGRNNKNIPNTSIVRMIKNKGYTGYLINGAVETECPQLRIIEPELFEQAQELRQARTCERGGTSLGTSSKALLTGLVYCGHCGNRLSLTSSGRTHTYADGHTVKEVRPRYSCFYKIRHPGDCDGQSGYGVSKLDSIVEEVVRQIFAQFREVSRKKLLESVKTNDAARIQKKIKKIQKDLEAKQKELDDLKAETILVIRGVSALDKELLGTLVAEAKDALETLEKQLVQAQEEYDEAVADNVYDRIQLVNIESETNSINSYFVDELTDQVIQDLVEQKGYTETQAYKALYQGGLTIYSTQDPEIQAICDDEVNNLDNYPTAPKVSFSYRLSVRSADGSISNYSEQTMLSYYQSSNKSFSINFNSEEEAAAAIEQYKTDIMKDGDTIVNGSETVTYTLQPQAALTIIDQSTGNVKALVGGRGDKTANKTLNRAADTTRQPGSTFKIIAAYAPALDAGGLTLASVQDDAPYNYGSGQGGAVNNYDNRYRGFTTLREAITNSINIVTVKTLAQIGPSLGYDYICDFGITTVGLDESSNETLALGGLTHGVTNLELTAAYATIANSGTYIKPKFYTKILDHDGNVLIDNTEPVSHTVLKDTTAWLLTDAMKDVMTQGTGTPAYFGSSMAQAGKSGTTTKNRDALFAGFTPYYTCVVWGGFDDNSPQSGGQTTYPKKIWKAVMSRIHENLEYQDFTKPSGIVTAQVCKESGKLAIAGVCDADPRGSQVYTEYFAEGTQPTEYCDHHIVANICNASGQLAGGYCPADSISSRVFVIGGTVGTEDTPYLLTDDFKNNTCTMHNEGNSTYQGTSAFSAVPGVNNDTSGGTQAPADNTQQTQPPANNSGGDNSDSTPADTGGTDNSGGGSSDNTPANTGGTDNSSGDNNSDGNGG